MKRFDQFTNEHDCKKCWLAHERRDKLEHYAFMGAMVLIGIVLVVAEIVHNLRVQELLAQCFS